MSRPSRHPLSLLMVAALWAVACSSDPSAPVNVRQEDGVTAPLAAVSLSASPNFINAAPGAPRIANPVVSFYAKVGVDREAFMYYQSRPGHADSTVFARFRVRKRSLAVWPNGTPFVPGDSIQITMTLVDPVHLAVDFQPAGLLFSPADPARLKMKYLEADHDFNHDGVVNGIDANIEKLLAIWRRELPTDPWIKQTSILRRSIDEVETAIGGFTSYLIAW